MEKIIVHNIEEEEIVNFFSEYKELKILKLKEIKSLEITESIYYDGSTNNIFFNTLKKRYNLEEFPYLFNTTAIKYKKIKVIKLPDLRYFLFYKNKCCFNIEKQNYLEEKYNIIKNIFDKTIDKYQNVFEKELDELPKILNITDIAKNEENYWFVKDKKDQIYLDGKVIDYRSTLLLLELKNILKYEVI